MARILVVGTIANDEVIRLAQPMREGTHMEGACEGERLGGGAANTGVALAHAGDDVAIVTAVGDDPVGDRLLAELEGAGVDLSAVLRLPGQTSRALIFLDEAGERSIVNLKRVVESEPPERLLEMEADLLYIRSRARNLSGIIRRMAHRCPVVVHLPPTDLVAPAQVLLCSASDMDADFLADPFEAGLAIAGDALRWVVVTDGPAGAAAYGLEEVIRVPAPSVQAIDSTGAGDAFAAGLCHALAAGAGMRQALETGCAWGAEKVRWRASCLPKEAVSRLLSTSPPAAG